MASVRITGDLIRGVEQQINAKFYKQSELVKNTLSKTFGDRVYAHTLRKELKAMELLPNEFFAQSNFFSAVLQHFENPDIKANLNLTTSKSIPFNVQNSYSTHLECTNSQLYDEYRIMNDKLNALNSKQNSVRNTIVDGIKHFTTLRKFLSIMPEAEMFIPQRTLDTHYANTPKKEKAPVENVAEGLTPEQRVTLAHAKMMGG